MGPGTEGEGPGTEGEGAGAEGEGLQREGEGPQREGEGPGTGGEEAGNGNAKSEWRKSAGDSNGAWGSPELRRNRTAQNHTPVPRKTAMTVLSKMAMSPVNDQFST